MIDDLSSFPHQFDFYSILLKQPWVKALSQNKPRTIFLAGMGGSSLPGDLLNQYLEGYQGVVFIRDYHLPSWAGCSDLVVCSSYSGNTEETLSVFHECQNKKIPVLVMTHGGQLKQWAHDFKLPLIEIPSCIQPRCAVGYFFTGLLALYHVVGRLPLVTEELQSLKEFLLVHQARHQQEGQKLVPFLKERVPLLFGPPQLEGLLRIWKIKFNENAKIQSFYNTVPELNHNEMVGYTRLLMNPAFVCVVPPRMNERISRRLQVMKEILGEQIPFYFVQGQGATYLETVFDLHAIADFSSYYLALEYGVDPAPVEMVETFKKRLG